MQKRIIKNKDILIAFDLDGTLLNNNKELTPKTRYYLKETMSREIKCCIVTGRYFKSALKFARKNNLYLPLVSDNGALIKDPFTMRVYYRLSFPSDIARKVIRYSINFELLLHVFAEEGWYVNKITDSVQRYADTYDLTPHLLDKINNLQQLSILKLVVIGDKDKNRKLENWIRNNGLNVNLFRSDSRSIDLVHSKASKGQGIMCLKEKMGLDFDRIIVVGNYYNDLSMFEIADFSVAVANSPKKVQEKADYVTASNQKEGVAGFLSKLLEIGPEKFIKGAVNNENW